MYPNKLCQPIKQYFSVTKNRFIFWNSGPTGIYLFEFSNNNSWIKCEIRSKLTLTIEGPDVVLVSILLTLNIFDTLFYCFLFIFFADFEHVNARWNTLLLNVWVPAITYSLSQGDPS